MAATAASWPPLRYEEWRDTCDTLHAHTQLLGKLAVALAPPEPQLQHAALRLTARGWETAPLPPLMPPAHWSWCSISTGMKPSSNTAMVASDERH
jgi:hypothetical protein